jgi:FeS assembly SUF system protein|tara:strand:+ start:162098 stop:162625 length:528 start_codon:yes stop_codon:yes gene_type:complete
MSEQQQKDRERPMAPGPMDDFMDPALQSTNRAASPMFDGPDRGKDKDGDKSGERGKDYLDGFLKSQPNTPVKGAPGGELYEAVVETLREIYDPEIPVNIYDLGLIYGIEIVDDHAVVTMTLTTPHCPVAESMPAEVEIRTGAVPGVGSAEVNLVWDPPWDPAKMSDEAKLELGML